MSTYSGVSDGCYSLRDKKSTITDTVPSRSGSQTPFLCCASVIAHVVIAQMCMTFTLVSVVYATAVSKPGHGVAAPLAIGFTLFASAFVGKTIPDMRQLAQPPFVCFQQYC